MKIHRLGVVGCGLMGSGVAEAAARSGVDVSVVDLDRSLAEKGRDRVVASIARAQKAGKLTELEAKAAAGRIEYSADMSSLRDCQLVIEAVMESESEKIGVFQQLDRVVEAPDAILA